MLNATRARPAPGEGVPGEVSAGRSDPRDAIHVCMLADTFYPAFAGAALRFQGYFPGLRERGIEVEVVCGTPTATKARLVGLDPDRGDVEEGEFLPTETIQGVTVRRVRLPDAKSMRREYLLARALARHCRRPAANPGVVQLMGLKPAMIPGLLAVRRAGSAIVYTGTMTAELPSNPVALGIRHLRFGLPLRLADRVVVSTRAMLDYFRALGVKTPMEVIGNGVDVERFRPPSGGGERERTRASLGIGPDEPVLLFVGSVTPRKGVELLLEAWVRHVRRHPTSHLLIAGPERTRFDPAHADYHARLEALRRDSGAPERVRYLGVVENVPELMRAADVLVFPSRREGMGNVVLEAMASGLPVVLTPFTGLAEELGTAGTHYLLAGPTADEVAETIGRALEDEDLRARLARSGRRRAETHFDVRDTMDRYACLYRELSAGKANEA